MLLKTEITINWHIKNKDWYESKGYIFTSFRKPFVVSSFDLQSGCDKKINYICDYCNETMKRSYKDYYNKRKSSIIEKDSCNKCKGEKQKEGMIYKYGVDCTLKIKGVKDKSINTIKEKYGNNITNVFQVESIKEKIKETNIIKYGTENPMQLEQIKEKFKQTCLEKYGLDHYNKTEEAKNRYKKTCLEKYGVDNVSKVREFKDKAIQTNIIKYGVTHPMKNEKIKNKKKKTNIEKYGDTTPSKNKEVSEKMKNTNLKKYGKTCSLANEEIMKKARKTMLDRFGVEYPGQSPEIRAKANETFFKNQSISTSKQQIKILELLESYNFNTLVNYPVNNISLDIAMFISEDLKINVEYDGAYWHQDQKFDRRRDEFLKSLGWKILRIKSGHKIPDSQEVRDSISRLCFCDKKYEEIILSDWIKFQDYQKTEGV